MNYTRARNYRLYCKGKRVLDVELDGGRCLLGYNPKGLGKSYKNSISRGLYTGLPSDIHARTVKRINTFFPGYKVAIFPDRSHALPFLASKTGCELHDTIFSLFAFKAAYNTAAHSTTSSASLCLWRPFMAIDEEASIILPIFPQPGYIAPQVILFRENSGFHPQNIPLCSPILLHGLHHVLLLLQRAVQYGSLGSVAKIEHQPKKHGESLGITRCWFNEGQWKRFLPQSTDVWERKGPYVYVRSSVGREVLGKAWFAVKTEYPQLRVPQNAEQVIILPACASYGEQKLLRSFFERMEAMVSEKMVSEKMVNGENGYE